MSTTRAAQSLDLAPSERGPALLALREDRWFERKSIRVSATKLAEAQVGMANADGGVIVVGVSNGVVEGTDGAERHRNALFQSSIDFTQPLVRSRCRLIECDRGDGERDHLLLIEVEASEGVHTTHKDEVFLRVGDETRRLTFVQRRELLYDKGQATYEVTAVPGTSAEDLRLDLLEDYADAVAAPDALRLLAARGLTTRRGETTVGALLLFGEVPQAHLPTAVVRVLRYRGRDRGVGARQQLVDDVRCDGPVPVALAAARAAVQRLQPTRRALGSRGRFEDVPLVPEDAWLEGLVNAVVHRSYSAAGDHIRVEVFDDRIEVENPGRFPGLVTVDDPLNVVRFARNPRIARVCADLSFGQEVGEGIRRMFEEMRRSGLSDPLYEETQGSVRLTLSGEPADRELESRLPSGARQVVAALRAAGRLGTGDLEGVLGVTRPVAVRRLGELRDLGLVVWVGKSPRDPRAYWTLPD